MPLLILVRHGQSKWNLEKRFTGWVDIGLTPQGKLEACKAGELIKKEKIVIDYYFTSLQVRAIDTLRLLQDALRDGKESVNVWQLNERHYGSLTGLNKDEMKKKFGEKKIKEFRRSWNIKPDPLSKNSPYHPSNITTYKDVPSSKIPDTESLEDTFNRVISFYKEEIENKLKNQKNILISAHGNSLRALCKYLFKLDETKITKLEIPTGNPLLIKFNEKMELNEYKYLDQSRAESLLIT
tara:strand:+ start:58 stop:774 length:717 start_codon:yes stop_codon:yes gene_type:complete